MQEQLGQIERELKIRNYSSKTIKSYLYGLKKYFVYKKDDLEILDIDNIKDFLLFCEKKGVSERILNGSKPTDVLIRDDYAGYEKLPMLQQSCWAHLLRKSHEGMTQPGASKEMKKIHQEIKTIYQTIMVAIRLPVGSPQRMRSYKMLTKKLRGIADAPLTADDAKKVQTRIRHQQSHLLTALLYDGVPLTNNLAERTIRPMVVTRKISGGSRSTDGAQTHAVNMSILQTITMRDQPLSATLHALLFQGAIGKR